MTDTGTAIDLSPILTPILQAVGIAAGAIITAFVSWALAKWGGKLDAQTKAQIGENLDSVAMKAISAGVMASQQEIKDRGWDHTVTQSKIVAEGADYAIRKFSATLNQAGIDPTTPAGAQAVHDLINRALPAGTAAAAASPTTPPVPAAPTPPAVILQPIGKVS